MTNNQIASILRNVSAAYSIKDEKKYRFQIIAYNKAADSIEQLHENVEDLINENKSIPGVGQSLKQYLEELIKNGNVAHFDSVLSDIPIAVFPLLDIPGFGPKKAYKLVTEFKLKNPDTVIQDLSNLADSGKIATLTGFGEKSEKDILRSIKEYGKGKNKTDRMILPYANELAQRILTFLNKSPLVIKAYTLGSLRRKVSTIGDVDIAVSTNKPQQILDYFITYPGIERVIEKGDTSASIIVSSGKQIDLMTQSPNAFGALLQHFTGSKSHNIHLRELALAKGFSLSEYGIREKLSTGDRLKEFDSEEGFYKALGLDWIPPEIRENTGEIELAQSHTLPKLVELSDIRGDFHLHSSYPVEESHDAGVSSMEDILNKARSLGYWYVGFSEHNPSQSNHTQEQIVQLLQKRSKFIERLKLKYKKDIQIFSLMETDILPNGSLALPNNALELLDATIVSIHSSFSMDKKSMTKRVLSGLSHPKAKILAHPTGRLLNERSGYELEWDELFEYCRVHNKALEINSWYKRLDLPDTLVRRAIEKKVMLVIDTDSHEKSQMDLMEYGVSVARRGWATKDDILNTMEYNKVLRWFNS